jgi:hypothetical protein
MSEIAYKSAWRKNDPDIETDVLAFWRANNLIPPTANPAERLRELCTVAYEDGRLIAVSTAKITEVGFVRSLIAMWRCAIAPDRRGQHISTEMGRVSREVLEEWSRDHPEERVMGMGTAIQTANLDEKKKRPIWKASGLVFVGYSAQDQQLRIAWFDHAEIE